MFRTAGLMLVVFLLSSCATMSPTAQDLAGQIRRHELDKRRVVIFGEGVSHEAANRLSAETASIVLYSPVPRKPKTRTSGFSREVAGQIKAIADSADKWEVIVPQRSHEFFLAMLKKMARNSLSTFQGAIVLPMSARQNQTFLEQIRRVFGEGVKITYLTVGP